MLHLDIGDLKPHSILSEFRYRQVYRLPELKYKILDRFSSLYPIVDSEKIDSVTMIDPDERRTFSVQTSRWTFEAQRPASYDDYFAAAKFVATETASFLAIQSFSRVGTRVNLGVQVESPREAFDYAINRYFSSSVKRAMDFFDDSTFPAVAFLGRKGNLHVNITTRYQEFQSISVHFNQPSTQKLDKLLLFDVDIYRDTSINNKSVQDYWSDVSSFLRGDLPIIIRKMGE